MTTQAHFIPLKKLKETVSRLKRVPQGNWYYWDQFWRWFFVLTLVAPLLRGILASSSSYGQSRRERLAQVIGLPTRLFVRYPLKWFFAWFVVDPCQTPWRLAWERVTSAKNFWWRLYYFLQFIAGMPSRLIKFIAYTSLLRSIIIPYIIEPLFIKSYFSRWKENYYKYCDKHELGWIPGMVISAIGAVISLVPRLLYYFLVKPLITPWQELYNDAVGVGGKLSFAISHIVKFVIVWPVEYILLKPLFSSMRESWDNESGYTLLLMTKAEALRKNIINEEGTVNVDRPIDAKPILIRDDKNAYFLAYNGKEWVQSERFNCADEAITDVIKQGWEHNKHQVTITTQADRDFVAKKNNSIKIFEHNNIAWWILAVFKQFVGLPVKIAIRWPLLALEYMLTGPTDLWPWQEEDESEENEFKEMLVGHDARKKRSKRRYEKRSKRRHVGYALLYSLTFFTVGWPIIVTRKLLKGIFITPFTYYQTSGKGPKPLNFLHYLNPIRGVVYLIWRFCYKKVSDEFAEACLEAKVKIFAYTLGAIKVFTSAGMYWLLASLVLAYFCPPTAVFYIGCAIFALANGYVAKKTRFRSIIAKVYLLFAPTTDPGEAKIQAHFRVMMRRGIFISAIFASVTAGFSGYLGGYSLVAAFGLIGLSGPFAPIALGVLLFLFAAASVTAYLCFQAATAYDNVEKVTNEVALFTIVQLPAAPPAIGEEVAPDFLFYVDDYNRLKCRFICRKSHRVIIKTVSRRDLTLGSKIESLSNENFNNIKKAIKNGGKVAREYIAPYVEKQAGLYAITSQLPTVKFSKVALPQESEVQIYVKDEADDDGHVNLQLKCRFTSYKQKDAVDNERAEEQANRSVSEKKKIIEKTISKEDLQLSAKDFNNLLSDLRNNKPVDAKIKARIDAYLAELPDGPEMNYERNISFAALFLALFASTATISFFKTNGALLDSVGSGFGRIGLLAAIIISPDTVIKALTQVLDTSREIEHNRQSLEKLERAFTVLSSRDPFAIFKFFLTGLDTTGDFIITILTMPPILIIALGVGLPCRIIAYGIALGAAIFNWLQSCVFTGKKVCDALGDDSDEQMIQALPRLYRDEHPCIFYNPATGEVYYVSGYINVENEKRQQEAYQKIKVKKIRLKLKTRRAIQTHLKNHAKNIEGCEKIKKVSEMRIFINMDKENNKFFDGNGDIVGNGNFEEDEKSLDYLIYDAVINGQTSINRSYKDGSGNKRDNQLLSIIDDNDSESSDFEDDGNALNNSNLLFECGGEQLEIEKYDSKRMMQNKSKSKSKSVSPPVGDVTRPNIMECIEQQKRGKDDFNFSESGWIDLCLAKAGIEDFAVLSDKQAGLIALFIWVGYIYGVKKEDTDFGVKKADTDFSGFKLCYKVYQIMNAINSVRVSAVNDNINQKVDYESILKGGRVAEVGKRIKNNKSFSLEKRVSDSYGKFKCAWFSRDDCQSVERMHALINNDNIVAENFSTFFGNQSTQEDWKKFEAKEANINNYNVYYVN